MIEHCYSIQYQETTDKAYRANMGQFFTTKRFVDKIVEICKEIFPKGCKNLQCLEPSSGTGDLVNCFRRMGIYKKNVECYELDKKLVKLHEKRWNDVKIVKGDFLLYDFNEKTYDLVISNPPYVELKKLESSTVKEYKKNFKNLGGKLNTYALFVFKCVKLLKPEGVGIFIIPTSLRTGPSFLKIREELSKICIIVKDVNMDRFSSSVSQDVMILVLKKYLHPLQTPVPFFKEFESEENIESLGAIVSNGQFVWNNHKDILSDQGNIFIMYSSNIPKKGNVGILMDILKGGKDKKQYIQKENSQMLKRVNTSLEFLKFSKLPVIFVSRTVGSRTNPRLTFTIVENFEFPIVCENHILSITHSDVNVLKRIASCLVTENVKDYLKTVCGSINLSKNQLLGIPINENEK